MRTENQVPVRKAVSPDWPETARSLAVVSTIAIGAVLAVCFARAYVRQEQPVYVWDWRNYWTRYWSWGASLRDNPLEALVALRWNVFGPDDYNGLPAALLYPFFRLWGGGRESFIVAIVVAYLVPAALAFAVCARWLTRGSGVWKTHLSRSLSSSWRSCSSISGFRP